MLRLLWIDVNLAHVHLLLNHVPTVGFCVGLGLLVLSLVGRSHEDMKKASLIVLFVVAVLTIPVYLTGNAAEAILAAGGDAAAAVARGAESKSVFPPGVLPATIRAHEDAALVAMIFMEFTGAFAWLALWQWRGRARLPGWNLATVLLLSVFTLVLISRAAALGGDIHHPEIRVAQQLAGVGVPGPDVANPAAPAVPPTGMARKIGLWVTGETWVWPASETLHFIGLCLLFTVVFLVDLRLLGIGKAVPISALFQLLPLGMLGFGLNLITGMLFFLGSPGQYIFNITFLWKFLLVIIAALNDLYLMLCADSWRVGRGDDAPLRAKFVAASGIALWIGVLFCGHMLPFIGNAF